MKRQIYFSVAVLVIFLATSFSYLWEENSGILSFFFGAFLFLGFLTIIVIQFISLLVLFYERKFETGKVLLNLFNISLLVVLYFFPLGFFKPSEKRTVFLEAFSEGAANCTTSLKLFTNKEFEERNICFGITTAKGNYKIENDTILFDVKILPSGSNEFFKYALVEEEATYLTSYYFNDSKGRKLNIINKN